jgi:hypothetical protein
MSCIPVWTPSLLMRLITQVTSLDTSSFLLKIFPRSGFFNFGNKWKSGGLNPPDLSNQTNQQRRRPDRTTRLAQMLDRCKKSQWRLHWGPINVFCKINSFLKRKHTVCRTSEMTHVVCLHVHNEWSSLSAWSKKERWISRIEPSTILFLSFSSGCRLVKSDSAWPWK